MKKHLTLKFMTLAVLVAIAAVGASAQTSTSTGDATTAAVVPAVPTDPLPAAGAPTFPKPANVLPAQGAGSTKDSYVWVRGYIFKVHRSNGDPAVINSNALGNTTSVENFDYGTEKAFKIEGGWNSPTNHFGFRLAYFRSLQGADISHTATAGAPFILSPRPLNVTFTGAADAGTVATFSERFRLQVIDIEGTYKWGAPTHSVVLSGGVRIAPSSQIYQAHDIFATTPEVVGYTQRRTGVGPTFGVDLRQHLGGGFWVTAAGRAAVLFGSIRETASYAVTGFVQTPTRISGRTQAAWEGEGGLEWSSSGFFVNGSFIFHDWQNLVNVMPTPAVGASAFAPLDNPANPPTKKGSVRFVGGAFSAGFRF